MHASPLIALPGEFNMIHPSSDWTHPLIVVMATRSLHPYSFKLLTPIKSYVSELYALALLVCVRQQVKLITTQTYVHLCKSLRMIH